MKRILFIIFLLSSQAVSAQVIVDSCFSSATPGTGFASSGSLFNSATGDSDLIEWDGGQWIGDWPGDNLTIPPPAGGAGCRAVFIGSGTAWTTGGEGFELLLDAPLVAGNTYSYDFTYISHGTGSNGNFTPEIYTNNAPALGGAFQMPNLPPVGFAWTTNTYTFTATAAQAGHNYLLIHSGSGASTSSGLINNFCQSCNVPPACGDPTITAAGPFCETDAAVNLSAVDGGGTWIGTGITDANLGTFDPATAGPGVHNIIYDLTCDSDNINITVNATDDPSFSYASGSYCLSDPNPTPTITGLGGGTFSIDNGGIINTTTGEIDLNGSGLGSYVVTYLTNGPCPTSTTFNIAIISSADATITAAGPFCDTDPSVNLIAATAGGTWGGTGITDVNLGTFDPATAGPGTHTITYTITGSCGDTDTEDITVNATDDPSFSYPSGSYCLLDANPTPTITGLSGGTFSIDNSGVIDAGTGEVDLNGSGIGSYVVTYLTNGPCPSSTTFNITISNTSDATITAAGPFCENDPAINLTAASGGGTWSGNGITDPNLGTFNPSTAGAGTHTITYTITGACGDTDTEDIIVNASDAATISYPSSTYCDGDADPSANISGTVGGVFTIDNGGTIDAGTGEIDLSATGAGVFTITYTTTGPCPAVATFNITIGSGTQPIVLDAGPFCLGDGANTLSATPTGGIWGGPGIVDTTNGVFNADTAGLGSHTITYTTTGSCGGTANTTILVDASPLITTIPDTLITYPQCVELTATGAETYNWTPDYNLDCNDCNAPTACPIENTEYCVIGTNSSGCQTTECVKVYVNILCGDVFVPSAFSPNDDGENDLECVYSDCIESMTFTIYNRWGEKVFETDNMNICWDGTWKGKELNAAVFVYVLDAHLITGERFTKKGNISLIR